MNNGAKAAIDQHAFSEHLERAVLHPETHTQKLVSVIQEDPPAYFPHLVKVFENTDVPSKRFVADLFKGPFRSQASEVLLPYLAEEEQEKFYWSAQILTDIGEKRAFPGFQKGLWSGKKSMVLAGIRGFSSFPGTDSLAPLIEFILKNRDWVYLSAAMRSLVPRATEVVPIFLEKFPSLPDDRKAWALKYLAETGHPQALSLFQQVLKKDPLKLGLFCITGLGKIGTPDAVRSLGDGLANPEWFIRKRIVEALGHAQCRDAIPHLLKCLVDPSVQVKASTVESLSKVGEYDLDQIVREFDKDDHTLRIGLIKVSGQIKNQKLVPPLLKTLSDRSTLFFSIDAIGDLGFPEAAPALEKFLTDSEWFNRLNALEALGKMSLPHIRKLAEKCLEDPNDMVRNAAGRIMAHSADH